MENTPAVYEMRINFALLEKQKQTLLDLISTIDPINASPLALDLHQTLISILQILERLEHFHTMAVMNSEVEQLSNDATQSSELV